MSSNLSISVTEGLKNAIHVAQSLAREYNNESYTPAHLLKGLLHKETGLVSLLKEWGEDIYYIDDWAEVRLEETPKATKIPQEIKGDKAVDNILYEAENIAAKLNRDNLEPDCVLAAICLPGVGFSYDQLKTFPLNGQVLIERLQGGVIPVAGKQNKADGKQSNQSSKGALFSYCTDLTEKARQNLFDSVVGREKELMSIAEIICRRSKGNVIITGDPGVGKTSLVHSLAISIAEKHVPIQLQDAALFELNTSDLIAGATYKGEMEDRVKNILEELRRYTKALLFIDDIQVLLDKNSGYQGLVNILASELSRGGFTLIAATSRDDYRKYIDNDPNLKRRTEMLDIDEPSASQASDMIIASMNSYTSHHNISISKEIIDESIKLAKRYIKERRLPDSAINLLDRTMAAIRIMIDTTPAQIERKLGQIESINAQDKETSDKSLKEIASQIKGTFSSLVFNVAEDTILNEQIDSSTPSAETIKKWLNDASEGCKNRKTEIELPDVASILARSTGIPVGKLMGSEQERLLSMEENLRGLIIGQDIAVKTVAEAILESRSGLTRAGQPIGSFFLLGPTGTGKTELAKQLAMYLFQDVSAMIRFDMSEFKEEHSAALLYGAPPGYVGYEEGGMLVNKIRQQPYAVVLFDEIEKAHNSVFDIFLQILDEGKLHDRLGKEGDFSNAVVLFTSNIGSKYVVDSFNEKGILPESNTLMEIMSKNFRPEFLGRLTGIVPFAPITKENIVRIFNLQLKELTSSLAAQKITFEMNDDVREMLAYEGFTPEYGARPLRSVIRSRLRTPLSRMIISGQLTAGAKVLLTKDKNNELKFNIE